MNARPVRNAGMSAFQNSIAPEASGATAGLPGAAGSCDSWSTESPRRQFGTTKQRAVSVPEYANVCAAGRVSRGTRWTPWCIVSLVVFMLCLAGCGSEASSTEQGDAADSTEENKEKKRVKPDLEFLALSTRPTDYAITVPQIKPGHWIEASQQMVANYDKFSGELEVEPIQLPGVPFALGTKRDVLLAKAQIKSIPLMVYSPPGPNRPTLGFELRDAKTGGIPLKSLNPMVRLPPHQYFFTVLTPEVDRFQFLRNLDSIIPPTGLLLPQGDEAHYRVVTPLITNNLALPTHLVTSTAVAYVLWDDVDPVMLSTDQKTALVDWLHWGGQLIINGPQTLDTLKNSFLADYLPADGEGVVNLPAAEVNKAFNSAWKTGKAKLNLEEDIPAQRLLPREGSDVLMQIDDAPVVVERRVGRGRVVTSAFTLANKQLVVWPDFDGFFNAAILRREPRSFYDDGFSELSVCWGEKPHRQNDMTDTMEDYVASFDPNKNSSVRLFSRDAQTGLSSPWRNRNSRVTDPNSIAILENSYGDLGGMNNYSGVGGWSMSNGVSGVVLQSLLDAAGIDVPRASFVVAILATYLIVLVPVNWAVFRVIGRVEWAWVAAPVITLVFALVVVKLAQLNIGFARAQTEIGIVELQGDYDRAHVTNYTAFYTSLGTNYQFDFDDPGAVAQPLSVGNAMFQGQRVRDLEITRGSNAEMSGFSVASNSLGLLQTENMHECEGGLQLRDNGSAWVIENKTGLDLRNVGVIAPGRFGWVGDLPGNATATATVEAINDKDALRRARTQHTRNEEESSPDALDVAQLIAVAEANALDSGETLLIGVHDGALPGVSVTPQSDQIRSTMVVVAHLDREPLTDPVKDNVSRPQAERLWEDDGFSTSSRIVPSVNR